ncbi:hypothetical protein EMIT07CA2_160066 [Brevibacillus sp. IT-7CA2]
MGGGFLHEKSLPFTAVWMNESLRFHYRTVANLEKAYTTNDTSRLSSMTGLTAFCYG